MDHAVAALSGLFFTAAIYLLLSRSLIRMLLGLTLLGNAVNLLILVAGRLTRFTPPIALDGAEAPLADAANPLPQALILTAIVIGFAMFSFLLVLGLPRLSGARCRQHRPYARGRTPGRAAPADELLMDAIQQTAPTYASDWVVILPVVLALAGAATLLALRSARDLQFAFALLVVAVVGCCDVVLLLRVVEIGPVSMTMGRWLPPFGISFTADIVSAVFALAAAVVTFLLLVYLRADMPDRARQDGVYPLILLLLAGVAARSSPAICSISMSGSR